MNDYANAFFKMLNNSLEQLMAQFTNSSELISINVSMNTVNGSDSIDNETI